MKFYSDGTPIPGTENDPDEQTDEVNPEASSAQEPEVPAFVLEMSRANEATRKANAEAERLRKELEDLRNPPPPPVKLEEGDAFNKPDKLLDAFRNMLEAQVGPLKRDAAEAQRARIYNDMKTTIKASNPAFAKIEHIVDQLMVGQEVTEANIVRCVEQAVGRMMLQNPAAFNTKPAGNNEQPNKSMQPPPHLTPKPISKQNGDTKQDAKYDLSRFDENEKRLMREKGLTPKQFVTLRDTDPNTLTPARYKEIMADKS